MIKKIGKIEKVCRGGGGGLVRWEEVNAHHVIILIAAGTILSASGA